jgi:hypothetical protein
VKEKNLATFSYKLFENYPDKKIDNLVEIDKLSAKGIQGLRCQGGTQTFGIAAKRN